MYAEKILGTIISNYELISQFNVDKSIFRSETHKKIFEFCVRERDMGFVTFDGSGFDKSFFGIITDILEQRSNDRNFEKYLTILKEKNKKIDLQEKLNEIIEKTKSDKETINDILNEMYCVANEVKNNSTAIDDVYKSKDIISIVKQIRNSELKRVSDVKYGYELLDKYALGMHTKQVTLLAAKTGKGKSSFAINILKNVGITQGHKILYISNEMDKERTVRRLLGCVSDVDIESFGNTNKIQDFLLDSAEEKILKSNIIITGNSPKTIADVSLMIRKENTNKDLKVIIYDYLGETKDDNMKDEREWEKLTRYTHSLLEIAKEQNIHIIILNQFSKESEKHNGFAARGSLLGGSGLLHKVDRFFYFDYDDRIEKYVLSIEKNRDGECVKIVFDFFKNTQLIREKELFDKSIDGLQI